MTNFLYSLIISQKMQLIQLRLDLTSLHPDDYLYIKKIYQDTVSMSYLPWIPIITSGWEDSDYRNLVTHQISEEQQGVRKNYILVSKESRKKIGAGCLTAIDYKESSCNLGLIIESAYFDQKFGTECIYQLSVIAFEELVLKRVTFETLNTNKPMIGWLEKVGKAKLINSNEKLVIGGVSYDMVKYEIDDVRWIQVSKQSLLDKLNRQ